MRIAFYSTLPFEQQWFDRYRAGHQITYIPETLTVHTALLAAGHQAVCAFVNDDLGRPVLETLRKNGVEVVGMRCVGLDNVDRKSLAELGMTLLHVPGYSPYSVAEQAVALLMGLVRHLPEASRRVQAGDFSIDGLMGTDLHGKTVGVVGTGHIGTAFARIMLGFGCTLLAYDLQPDRKLLDAGVRYVSLAELLGRSDVVSLHCPLTPLTDHLMHAETLSLLKPHAVLVNTGRGRLVETEAVLDALDAGRLGGYAADVYEGERPYFHYDFSARPIPDDLLNRLRTHPKVLLTAHQGFLTEQALGQISRSLLHQFSFFENQRGVRLSKPSVV